MAFSHSQERQKALFDSLSEAVLIVDQKGCITNANAYAQYLLGYSEGELIYSCFVDLLSPESIEPYHSLFQSFPSAIDYSIATPSMSVDSKTLSVTLTAVHQQGYEMPIKLKLIPFHQSEGSYYFLIFNKLPASAFLSEDQLYGRVLSDLNEGVYMVSADTQEILYANQRFLDMFGYSQDELQGSKSDCVDSVAHPEHKGLNGWIALQLKAHGHWSGELENRRKDGSSFWSEVKVSEFTHPEYGVTWVSIFSDITEKRFYVQHLWRQANYDELTQLPNRKYFTERVMHEISSPAENSKGFALLLLDLDDFKNINESLGHIHGDALLVEVAARIEQSIGDHDEVGRFGGDEFAVLLRNIDVGRPDHIKAMAENIMSALTAPFLLEGELAFITASIGLVIYPHDALDQDALFKYAEQAMFSAKSKGKNNIEFFTTTMADQALRTRDLIKKLRMAIEENQFEVFFQPIVESHTEEIYKAEALVRWFHPEEGMISPGEFIPLAEETKLINELGELVLEQGIQRLKWFRDNINSRFQLSINKSPIQFQANTILTEHTWQERMTQEGLPCSALNVEITEGLLLASEEHVNAKLSTMINQGFHFSIDDFGTGYSALAYLKRLRVQYLKIDQSFIRTLEDVHEDRVLCEAIIVMAHKLGMKVIAEGVETARQKALLKAMQCDYLQGYYFSRPLPFDDFVGFLKNHHQQVFSA